MPRQVVYDLSGCCPGCRECNCCSGLVPSPLGITLPTITTRIGQPDSCLLVYSGTGQSLDFALGQTCRWEFGVSCLDEGQGNDSVLTAEFTLQCDGENVVATLVIRGFTPLTGGAPETFKRWIKTIGADPIDCEALSVSFDAGDIETDNAHFNGGAWFDFGDDVTVEAP